MDRETIFSESQIRAAGHRAQEDELACFHQDTCPRNPAESRIKAYPTGFPGEMFKMSVLAKMRSMFFGQGDHEQ